MVKSLENPITLSSKVDANTFDIRRWSRWTDKKGRLFSLVGIYLGVDYSKPYSSTRWDRIAVDLLNVHDETVEYIEVGRFIKYVIDGQLLPWKKCVAPELDK